VAARSRRAVAGLRVGADIEAWCGKCAASTTHSIVAMVGAEPSRSSVRCARRDTLRTGPARRRTGASLAPGEIDDRPRVAVGPRGPASRAQLSALGEEVAAARRCVARSKERTRRARSFRTPSSAAARSRNCCARASSSASPPRRPQVLCSRTAAEQTLTRRAFRLVRPPHFVREAQISARQALSVAALSLCTSPAERESASEPDPVKIQGRRRRRRERVCRSHVGSMVSISRGSALGGRRP